MEDLYMLSDLQLQQKIGERLKSDRLMQNMTQANLAEDAGVSVSSIKKIEEGKIGSFVSLLRVMRVLGELDVLQPITEARTLGPNEYYELVSSRKNVRARASGRKKISEENTQW